MSVPETTATRHGEVRAFQRLNLEVSALSRLIDEGRGVRLSSTAAEKLDTGQTVFVRSGYLLFLPGRDEYCLVVISDRDRAIITVLTDAQAMNTKQWADEITDQVRARARVRAGMKLGAVEKLHAKVLDGVPRICYFRARTFDTNWVAAYVTVCKLSIAIDQIDESAHRCVLTRDQTQFMHEQAAALFGTGQFRPYAEFFLKHKNCGDLQVEFAHPGIGSLEEGEVLRRWTASS